MTDRVAISSTHVDLQGDRISKEALEMGAQQINSERPPRLGLEHDMTLPPLGRISQAEVLQGDDSEYYLVVNREYFDSAEQIQISGGEVLLKEFFASGGKPFREVRKEPLELIEISIDAHIFDNYNEVDQFYDEIERNSDIKFNRTEYLRKSFNIDPELIIRLSEYAVALFFSKAMAQKLLSKTGDKLAERIADDVAKIYDLIKHSIIQLLKRITNQKPPVYKLDFPASIQIELIAIGTTPDQLIEAIKGDSLQGLESKIDELIDRFHAEKIQFILNDNLKWELNYLLTVDGASIGTQKAFSRRTKVLQNMIQQKTE